MFFGVINGGGGGGGGGGAAGGGGGGAGIGLAASAGIPKTSWLAHIDSDNPTITLLKLRLITSPG